MEGIVAATSGAADALGLADVGRVDRGSVADLVVLDGDPLSEPAVLLDAERIRLVVRGARSSRRAPSKAGNPNRVGRLGVTEDARRPMLPSRGVTNFLDPLKANFRECLFHALG
jgi:hypothetical protein